jgi:hypothetical protein
MRNAQLVLQAAGIAVLGVVVATAIVFSGSSSISLRVGAAGVLLLGGVIVALNIRSKRRSSTLPPKTAP